MFDVYVYEVFGSAPSKEADIWLNAEQVSVNTSPALVYDTAFSYTPTEEKDFKKLERLSI